jgi:SAM-dependent methyltransferase
VQTFNYKYIGSLGNKLVLDLGCGAGRHAFESAKKGAKVIALDHDELELKQVMQMFYLLSEQKETVYAGRCIKADALSLPFKDNTFDCVLASEVLEHIVADTVVLGELNRVLKPGSVLGVSVPRFYPELVNWALSDEYYQVPGGHVRIYRRSILDKRLKDAGFNIYAHHFAHGLHSPYWWLRCLVGPQNETNIFVKVYKKILEYDIMHPNKATKILDYLASILMGKSLVIYAKKAN